MQQKKHRDLKNAPRTEELNNLKNRQHLKITNTPIPRCQYQDTKMGKRSLAKAINSSSTVLTAFPHDTYDKRTKIGHPKLESIQC
jgi:hypothetical protein